MLRNGSIYILLQIVNVSVGVFLTFFIAHHVDTNTYSLYAVYLIITSFFSTFSFLGYEAVLIRNALHWLKVEKKMLLEEYVTYAIFSRVVTSFFLAVPAFFYIYFLSSNKFGGEHFWLLTIFLIAGLFTALMNSCGLILKAFNKYILSFSILSLSAILGRLVAIYLFMIWGFKAFMSTLIVVPFISFLIAFFFIKKYFCLNVIGLKKFIEFTSHKYFIFSGYFNYVKVSMDQLVVSILLPAESLAVYNIAKKIEDIGRTVISGIFEPALQQIVGCRDDAIKANRYIKRVLLFRKILFIIGIICILLFDFFAIDIIRLAELEHYNDLNIYFYIASCTPLIYLAYKVEMHIIHLFESPKKLFAMDLIISVTTTIIAVAVFLFIDQRYIYSNRLIVGLSMLIFFFTYFKYLFIPRSFLSKGKS